MVAQVALSRPLPIGVNNLLARKLPSKLAEIKLALDASGVEVEFHHLPGKRVLNSLVKGDIAIDVYRTPTAIEAFDDVIQLNPAVDVQHAWLITGQPELCQLNAEERRAYSVAGGRGVRLFKSLYPNFNRSVEMRDFFSVATMVTRGRIDFGVWPKTLIMKMQQRKNINLHICGDKPYRSFAFHSYIHKSYDWAIPEIEQSYRHFFGGQYPP